MELKKDYTAKDLKNFQKECNLGDIEMAAIFKIALNNLRDLQKLENKVLPKIFSNILYLLIKHPELNPLTLKKDTKRILEIYKMLGFQENSVGDKKKFGEMIGISIASVYRIFSKDWHRHPKAIRYLNILGKLSDEEIVKILTKNKK